MYWVESSTPETGRGALTIGLSVLRPGRIGDEFAMTRGHLHAQSEFAELYYGLSGSGVMLLESVDGESRALPIGPGVVVHVPGGWVHRSVNVGDDTLVTLFAYATEAGQDYGSSPTPAGCSSSSSPTAPGGPPAPTPTTGATVPDADAVLADLARHIDISCVQAQPRSRRRRRARAARGGGRLRQRHVLPNWLPHLRDRLEGSAVLAGSPVAFPSGGATTATKVAEATELLELGAQELDVVVAIGRLRSGDGAYVERELAAVAEVVDGGFRCARSSRSGASTTTTSAAASTPPWRPASRGSRREPGGRACPPRSPTSA